MADMKQVEAAVKAALGTEYGEFKVDAKTTYTQTAHSRFSDSLSMNGTDDKKISTLVLDITNPHAETDPAAADYYAQQLSTLEALKPFIKFEKPEPEKDHLAHLADAYKELQTQAPGLLPDAVGEWFNKRAQNAANPKQDEIIYLNQGDHAMQISRNDNFVTASFEIPKDMEASEVQKSIEERSAAIKTLLARKAIDNLEVDEAGAKLISEQVQALDMVVTTQSYGSGYNNVNIEFRSPKVTEALKQPGGLTALSEEEQKALRDSNPLLKLKSGGVSGSDSTNLEKVIARAILFEGEKGEKPTPLFSKIAGTKDIKTLIEKSLKFIKAVKPELAEKTDVILKDEMFKDHSYWARKAKTDEIEKTPIRILKLNETNYVPGKVSVELDIPADKYTQVLEQIANPSLALGSVENTTVGAVTPTSQLPKDVAGQITPDKSSGRSAA